MSISINWLNKVISVPKSYLTFLGGTTYQLDVDQFRLDLKDIEDSETGIVYPKTHNHNTSITLSGVTYSRSIEIINGYTIQFEDDQYTVKCIGANHNISDVKVVNQVSLIIGNSAGLITVSGGGGAGGSADDIWDALLTNHADPGTFGERVQKLLTAAKFLALK